jgi:RimJ/RimL family protein N-acetyltransferase
MSSPKPVLNGTRILLKPLSIELLPDLIEAGKNRRIWEFYSFDASVPHRMEKFVRDSVVEQEQGWKIAFAIYHKADQRIIGSSALYDFNYTNRNCELGHTWINDQYWGQQINEEAKLLMLTYAFENLSLLRVHLKAWDKNKRSINAINRIGAFFEGYARNHMVREDGVIRTSAIFSIIKEEWPTVKEKLECLVGILSQEPQ